MSALEMINPARWAGRLTRSSSRDEGAEALARRNSAPGVDGGCIRGFIWAVAIEGMGLAALAVVAWGFYNVRL